MGIDYPLIQLLEDHLKTNQFNMFLIAAGVNIIFKPRKWISGVGIKRESLCVDSCSILLMMTSLKNLISDFPEEILFCDLAGDIPWNLIRALAEAHSTQLAQVIGNPEYYLIIHYYWTIIQFRSYI